MTEEVKEGHFLQQKITKLSDLAEGKVKQLPESDLCIQTDDHVIQFQYKNAEEEKKVINPGTWTFAHESGNLTLKKFNVRNQDLLESATNTARIIKEAESFRGAVTQGKYEKYRGRDPKRAVLLYSAPGMGKTATITLLSQRMVERDPGTVVVYWDTSAIQAREVIEFLSLDSKFSEQATNMLLVMEDIGGGNVERYSGAVQAEASLLELLDGAGVSFPLPTFIVATTNTPHNLIESLADRPGRFDDFIELMPPNAQERVALVEHIARREMTDEEKAVISGKDAEDFSIAHLCEVVVRSDIHEKTFGEVVDELKTHKKRVKNMFEKSKKRLGLNS